MTSSGLSSLHRPCNLNSRLGIPVWHALRRSTRRAVLTRNCTSERRTRGPHEVASELVTVPVSDVDRAKAFYVDQAGFSSEQDVRVDEEHRFVELMPPGSPCSIALTTGYVDSKPGSLKGVQVNVDDVAEVQAFLRDRGVDVSEIHEYPWSSKWSGDVRASRVVFVDGLRPYRRGDTPPASNREEALCPLRRRWTR